MLVVGTEIRGKGEGKSEESLGGSRMQAGGKSQKSAPKACKTNRPKPGDIWEKVLIEGRIKA